MAEHQSEKRGRGRPIGSKNKSVKFNHYKPKKWTAWHEAIVLASVSGVSGKEIAKTFDITETHVSNILCCEKAGEVREKIRKNIGEAGSKAIEDKFSHIRNKAVDRMVTFVDNDQIFTNAPIASVDRAMRMAEMTDERLRVVDNKVTNNNTLVLATEEGINRLTAAIEKSLRVSMKHGDIGVKPELKLISGG